MTVNIGASTMIISSLRPFHVLSKCGATQGLHQKILSTWDKIHEKHGESCRTHLPTEQGVEEGFLVVQEISSA